MRALFVVVRQPFLDGCKSLVPGSEAFLRTDLALHDGPEGFCRRIVPAFTFAAHGTEQTVVFERRTVRGAVVLRTLIRVNDKALRRPGGFQSRLKGGHHHWRGHVVRETGSQNSAAAKVNEGRDIRPAFGSPDVGDVARPHFVQGARLKLP